MIVMSWTTAILILGLWIPATGNVPLILFAALFGIASGAGIGLTPVLVAQLSPIKDIGIRTGTVFAFAAVAALTGSPIGGQIIVASKGDYRYIAVFGGVSCSIGATLYVVARLMLAGTKLTKI